MLKLSPPSVELRSSYIAAVHEFIESVVHSDIPEARELAYAQSRFVDGDVEWLADTQNFADFVERLLGDALPESPRPEGWVPSTQLWLSDGNEFLGTLDIRHHMTDFLFNYGGIIGYDIRPTARGKGYGTEILRLGLPFAKELGFDPALVTCHPDNEGSIGVILTNGGVFEDQRGDRLRYWVPASATSASSSQTTG